MKQIFTICLLGMGILLPNNPATAKEILKGKHSLHSREHKKIIDIWIEGDALLAESDAGSGSITVVKIFNSKNVKVMEQAGYGFSCAVDVSPLQNGVYSAKVFTASTQYTEVFSLY